MTILAAPSLLLIALDLRSEIETTATTWIGVAGYERTVSWALIPVYQNFINFGTPLPIMGGIANTPLALLGLVFPVQVAQQILILGALLTSSFCFATSKSLGLDTYGRTMPYSALNLLFTSHYFLVNDWSEVALSSFGLQVLVLLILEVNLEPRETPLRHLTMLWLGVSLVSTDHLGHIGVVVFCLLTLMIASYFNTLFRSRICRPPTLFAIFLLATFVATLWYPSVHILLQNSVSSNPRPRSLEQFFFDLLSLGLVRPEHLEWSLNPLTLYLRVAALRSLFLFVLPLIIFVAWRYARLKRSLEWALNTVTVRSLLIAVFVLSVLAVSSGSLKYPLRPSQDYFFRDAIIPLLLCAATLVTRNPNRVRSEPTRRVGWKPLVATTFLTSSAFAGLLALGIAGKAYLISRDEANLLVPGDCRSLEDGALILAQVEPEIGADSGNQTLWRRQQPANPFSPVDCTLLQMVEDGHNSIAGWLKIHQTPSDGKPWFELDNVTVRVPNAVLESLNSYYLYNGQDLINVSNKQKRPLDITEYERCWENSCILKIQTSSRNSRLIWNFNSNLRSTGSSVVSRGADGFMVVAGSESGSEKLIYDTPSIQKFSALASWALWVGFPSAITVARTGSPRVRDAWNGARSTRGRVTELEDDCS